MTFLLEMIFWAFRFLLGAGIFSLNHLLLQEKNRVYSGKKAGRYIILGSTGGVAFVWCVVFYGIGKMGVISLRGLLVFAFLAVLMEVALIDWETRMIYDRFHVIIFVLGVAAVWLFPEHGMMSKVIGALLISVPMLLLTLAVPGAFGGGDIKLMAACGWLLGMKSIVCAMFLGLFTGGIYCAVLLAQKKIGRREHFAFGPWLAIGLAVAAFYGDFLVDGYLKIFF